MLRKYNRLKESQRRQTAVAVDDPYYPRLPRPLIRSKAAGTPLHGHGPPAAGKAAAFRRLDDHDHTAHGLDFRPMRTEPAPPTPLDRTMLSVAASASTDSKDTSAPVTNALVDKVLSALLDGLGRTTMPLLLQVSSSEKAKEHVCAPLANNSVGSFHLQDGAVTASKLGFRLPVAEDFFADGCVTDRKIAGGAVQTRALADAAVTIAKMASNSVSAEQLADASVSATKLASDSVTNDKIATHAVTSSKIGHGQVLRDHLASSAVGTEEIADGSITMAKLARDVILPAPPTVVAAVIPESKQDMVLADGAVTEAKLQDLSVSNAKLQDFSVSHEKLAAGAVTAAKIQDAAVGTFQLADGAISGPKLADGAVTADKLADGCISARIIPNGAIGKEKLAFSPAIADMVTGRGTLSEDCTVTQPGMYNVVRPIVITLEGKHDSNDIYTFRYNGARGSIVGHNKEFGAPPDHSTGQMVSIRYGGAGVGIGTFMTARMSNVSTLSLVWDVATSNYRAHASHGVTFVSTSDTVVQNVPDAITMISASRDGRLIACVSNTGALHVFRSYLEKKEGTWIKDSGVVQLVSPTSIRIMGRYSSDGVANAEQYQVYIAVGSSNPAQGSRVFTKTLPTDTSAATNAKIINSISACRFICADVHENYLCSLHGSALFVARYDGAMATTVVANLGQTLSTDLYNCAMSADALTVAVANTTDTTQRGKVLVWTRPNSSSAYVRVPPEAGGLKPCDQIAVSANGTYIAGLSTATGLLSVYRRSENSDPPVFQSDASFYFVRAQGCNGSLFFDGKDRLVIDSRNGDKSIVNIYRRDPSGVWLNYSADLAFRVSKVNHDGGVAASPGKLYVVTDPNTFVVADCELIS